MENKNININFDEILNDFKKMTKNTKSKNTKSILISSIIISLIYGFVFWYFILPPINLHSVSFWIWIISSYSVFYFISLPIIYKIKFIHFILIAMVVAFVFLNFLGLKLFSSKKYSNIIEIKDSNFIKDVAEIPYNKIPTLDRDSSEKVGSRKMGELLDLVSQFDIDNLYTQINLNNKPVRVTPLKYNGFFKYLGNNSEGLPGYVTVDIITGEANLVKLENKIKYSQGDYFFRDIDRYVRIKYPFDIVGEKNFEIDENGNPFWVYPVYQSKIGWFKAYDVTDVILINASTGETQKFNVSNVPKWIDRVYEAENIVNQLNWNGKYKLGFFNSIFAQKNVLKTTDGYNYLALNDDVYLYTGYTSVASDESNVGFILTNLRTKETKFYPISSAEEFSAMSSAEGAVQEKKYVATFPLLLNVKNNPTYFLSLKDNSGLIKLYAFIDAKDYQKVSIGSTVKEALSKHTDQDVSIEDTNTKVESIQGVVSAIKSVVINGNTHYYFLLKDNKNVYVTNIALSEKLPFLKEGSKVKFEFIKKKVNEVVKFEIIE